jgi:hypothetical protein
VPWSATLHRRRTNRPRGQQRMTRAGAPILVFVLSAQVVVMPALGGAERSMQRRLALWAGRPAPAFAPPSRLPVQQRRGPACGQVRELACSSPSFRTEVHVKPMPFKKLNLDDPLFLMGSCFSEVASLPAPLLAALRRKTDGVESPRMSARASRRSNSPAR